MLHTDINSILNTYWGYGQFRPLQADIINSVLAGHDTLGLMPTGGGKSITFQVPALAMDGMCIVVTPLIALMKDQVENLRKRDIAAAAIFSGMSSAEISKTLDNAVFGAYKFLYVSPERLGTDLFVRKVVKMKINLIAVDESHCISQWGYDFRPSYLLISDLRDLVPEAPVLALTATATPVVVKDIQDKLHFREGCKVFRKSFARKNLQYVVRYTDDKLYEMLKILDAVPGSSIVYVRNRKKTREIAEFLSQNGVSADYFHAGLSNEVKDERQMAWKKDKCRVIVATNAFGMGIDKPEVRTVIHVDLPDTLEAYFQEAGRAGRDEKTAYAVLLYSGADKVKLQKRVEDSFPDKVMVRRVYEALFNYFQIAEHEGCGDSYRFSLAQFCSIYHFNVTRCFSAIMLMQSAGFLEYEETEARSRVVFTVNRDELYERKTTDFEDRLMSALLRNYSGLFTDYAYIDEWSIAKTLDTGRKEVYEGLVELRRNGIVDYIPLKREPLVTIKQNRVDISLFHLPRDVYEDRKKQMTSNISHVIEYAEDKIHCRSRILLSYFGETNSEPCGHCDVCLERKHERLGNADVETMKVKIGNAINSYMAGQGKENRNLPPTISELYFLLDKEDAITLRKTIDFLLGEGMLVWKYGNRIALP